MSREKEYIDLGNGDVFILDIEKFDEVTKIGYINKDFKKDNIISTLKKVTKDETDNIKEVVEETIRGEMEYRVNPVKYDILTTCLQEILMKGDDDHDTTLGFDNFLDNSPVSFKLSFNTLLHYDILKKI